MSTHRSLSFREIAELFRTDQKKAQKNISALFGRTWPQIAKKRPDHTALIAEHVGQLFYRHIPARTVPALRIATALLSSSRKELRMVGAVMLGEYGRTHPHQALALLKTSLRTIDRRASTFAFKRIFEKHPENGLRFLRTLVLSRNKVVRTFICKALRTTISRTSPHSAQVLRIAHWLMKEGDLTIKQILGETLSALSAAHPKEVFAFLSKELARGNLHTYWTVYRACDRLAQEKNMRAQVLGMLNISTYHTPHQK